MESSTIPSLRKLTLVKISTLLWSHQHVRSSVFLNAICPSLLVNDSWWYYINENNRTLNIVLRKLSQLPLPQFFKDEIIDYGKQVCYEMLKWMGYHRQFFVREPKLYWTPEGTIDKIKTAEFYVKDDTIGVEERYQLACNYCFENEIPLLWSKLPDSHKNNLYSDDAKTIADQGLVTFWTYHMKGETHKLTHLMKRKLGDCNAQQYGFYCAVEIGNRAAATYLLQKLTPQEREELAAQCLDSVELSFIMKPDQYADILCFLIVAMPEIQARVSELHRIELLGCFLEWPWQKFFMKVAATTIDTLTNYTLNKIVKKIQMGYRDFNYHKLFEDCWNLCEFWKKSQLDIDRSYSVLPLLFDVGDRGNIGVVLSHCSIAEKQNIILSCWGIEICAKLIFKENWNLLRFFMGECIFSKDKMIEFTRICKCHFSNSRLSSWRSLKNEEITAKWRLFRKFVSEFLRTHELRESFKECDSSLSRKYCCQVFQRNW